MQLTTFISATLVTCAGFAAAAPNKIPVEDLTWPADAPALPDYKGLTSGVNQNNGDVDDDDDSYLEKRGPVKPWVQHVKFCVGYNGEGPCNVKDFKAETGCYNVWSWYNDKISSIQLAPRTMCMLFADANCRGKWLKAFDPGYKNLKTQSLMDNKISSMKCTFW